MNACKNRNGFAAIYVLLSAVAIVIVAGGASFYFLREQARQSPIPLTDTGEVIIPSLNLELQTSGGGVDLSAKIIGEQDGVKIHSFTAEEARIGFEAPMDQHVFFQCPAETTPGIRASVANGDPLAYARVRYWLYEYSGNEAKNIQEGQAGLALFDGRFHLSAKEQEVSGAYAHLHTQDMQMRPGKRYYIMIDGKTAREADTPGSDPFSISCMDSDSAGGGLAALLLPNDADGDGLNDSIDPFPGDWDGDGDGVNDGVEVLVHGTDPADSGDVLLLSNMSAIPCGFSNQNCDIALAQNACCNQNENCTPIANRLGRCDPPPFSPGPPDCSSVQLACFTNNPTCIFLEPPQPQACKSTLVNIPCGDGFSVCPPDKQTISAAVQQELMMLEMQFNTEALLNTTNVITPSCIDFGADCTDVGTASPVFIQTRNRVTPLAPSLGSFDYNVELCGKLQITLACQQDPSIGGGVTGWCGDGFCDPITEGSNSSCPIDCGTGNTGASFCGDGTCDPNEDWTNCPSDCIPPTPSFCGDGTCDPGEDASVCSSDCGGSAGGGGVSQTGRCGDGTCDFMFETMLNCPGDCPPANPVCGNGICDPGEQPSNCWQDCPICGNNICEIAENVTTCLPDCGGACCPTVSSGFPSCEMKPDAADCTSNGGQWMGFNVCANVTCPSFNICGDGTCGPGEDSDNCQVDCPGMGGSCCIMGSSINCMPLSQEDCSANGGEWRAEDCNEPCPGLSF